MGGAGFEPAKAVPPDLQSGPFGRLGIHPDRRVAGAAVAVPRLRLLWSCPGMRRLSRPGGRVFPARPGRAGGESRTHNRRFTKPVLCRLSYASVHEAVKFPKYTVAHVSRKGSFSRPGSKSVPRRDCGHVGDRAGSCRGLPAIEPRPRAKARAIYPSDATTPTTRGCCPDRAERTPGRSEDQPPRRQGMKEKRSSMFEFNSTLPHLSPFLASLAAWRLILSDQSIGRSSFSSMAILRSLSWARDSIWRTRSLVIPSSRPSCSRVCSLTPLMP
jgi:hypothetical protein